MVVKQCWRAFSSPCSPTQRMLGRLRCPAAGNEDGLVFPIGSYGAKEMIVSPAFLPVLPEPSIFLKAVDWGWIRMVFVKTRTSAATLAASALGDSWSFMIPAV